MVTHSLLGHHDPPTRAHATTTASPFPYPPPPAGARTKRQPSRHRPVVPSVHVPVADALNWPLEPAAARDTTSLPMTFAPTSMSTTETPGLILTTTTAITTADPTFTLTSRSRFTTTTFPSPWFTQGSTTLVGGFPSESGSTFGSPSSTAAVQHSRSSNQADNIVMIASIVASIGLVVLGVGCYRLHLMRKLDQTRSQPQSQRSGAPHCHYNHPHTSDQRLFDTDPGSNYNSPYVDPIYLAHPSTVVYPTSSDPPSSRYSRYQYPVSMLPPLTHANTSIPPEPILMRTLERTTALLIQPQGQSLPPNLLLPISPDLRPPTAPSFVSGPPPFRPQNGDRYYRDHSELTSPVGSPMPMASEWPSRPFPRGRGRNSVGMGRRQPPRQNSQMESDLIDDEELIRRPPPPPYDGHRATDLS